MPLDLPKVPFRSLFSAAEDRDECRIMVINPDAMLVEYYPLCIYHLAMLAMSPVLMFAAFMIDGRLLAIIVTLTVIIMISLARQRASRCMINKRNGVIEVIKSGYYWTEYGLAMKVYPFEKIDHMEICQIPNRYGDTFRLALVLESGIKIQVSSNRLHQGPAFGAALGCGEFQGA